MSEEGNEFVGSALTKWRSDRNDAEESQFEVK